MSSIIVALPKLEDAKHIRDILHRYGLKTAAICTTGSNVLAQVHQLDAGVVISGKKFCDMNYIQLMEYLPESFEMLLLASRGTLESCPLGIMKLAFPIRANDLVGSVEMICTQLERKYGKVKRAPKKRTEREQNYINNAKWVLMERNNMTEQEAFRYIQKCSMDTGTNMVETAQMILLLIHDE